MKRAVCSLALGPLFTFLMLTLSVDGIVSSIAGRLLFISAYFGFYRTWFRIDCPNADSIADKMTCAGIMMAASAVIYVAIFYFASFLIWRRKREDELTVDHNMAGPTLGIDN